MKYNSDVLRICLVLGDHSQTDADVSGAEATGNWLEQQYVSILFFHWLLRIDDVMMHNLLGHFFRSDEGGACVSPDQEEAEPDESSASQGKWNRKHKRKSDGECVCTERGLVLINTMV